MVYFRHIQELNQLWTNTSQRELDQKTINKILETFKFCKNHLYLNFFE